MTGGSRVATTRTAALIAAACGAMGCGVLTGLDDYEVSSDCPKGSFRNAGGQCVTVRGDCTDEQIPVLGADCADIPAVKCGQHFVPDEERGWGCRPIIPDCASDWLGPLGSRDCAALVFNCSTEPGAGAEGLFVKADAAPNGTGLTRDSPVQTIREALALAASRAEEIVEINLFQGTYRGSLRFERSIKLNGACATETIIIGDAGQPVIDVGPNADGSSIGGLSLRGDEATAGVRIDGAQDVTLGFALIVGPVAGPGITFEDTSEPTSGALGGVAVDRAVGIGVAAYGASKLDLDNVRVVQTRPDAVDGRGIGVLVAPSVSTTAARVDAEGAWDETTAHRSVVSIFDSRIAGARGAGILVEGSDAHIDSTSVRDVVADDYGRSAGVLVRRRWLGDLAATLVLERSTIENIRGAGVRLDDVDSASISDTTIHDVTSVDPTQSGIGDFGGCGGNGIRARARLPRAAGNESTPAPDTPLIVERVSMQATREAAVHVEGLSAVIRDSLLRDVSGCSPGLGDGIAAYGYAFSPAAVAIEGTRISQVARAAVSAFGADVTVKRSFLDACKAIPREESAGASNVEHADENACSCNGSLSLCSSTAEPGLAPALLAFPECDQEISACVSACSVNLVQGTALGEWATWDPDHDGLASALAGPDGCVTIPHPADIEHRMVGAKSGFTPAVALNQARPHGTSTGSRLGMVGSGNFGLLQTAFFPDSEQPNARNALFLAFQVCLPPEASFSSTDELCLGHGVEGASGELLAEDGAAIVDTWAEAHYFGDASVAPEPGIHEISKNATGYFYNLPPGRYLLRLNKPAKFTSMSCSVDPGWGWAADEPNTYHVYAEAGLNNVAVRAFCDVH